MHFANIRNEQIIDMDSQYLDNDIIRVQVSDEIYESYLEDKQKVVYQNGDIIINPNFEAEKAKKERERLDMLSLTAADVERAIYKAKGIDFEDILALVKDNPEIDSKALKIELKANNFYRGNSYVEVIGNILGFNSEQLDEFFKTGELNNMSIEESR